MNLSPEKIAPPVAFVIIGAVIFLIGATGTIPIGNPPLVISESIYKTILVILGVLLIVAGPVFVWLGGSSDEHGASTSLFARKLSKSQFGIIICADDEANIKYLSNFVDANSITKARMIQYSGDMVRPIISKLLAKNVKVEILLQHPQKALNIDQLVKMENFHERVKTDFKNPQNLAMKYYTEPASVRGIKLDDKVLLMGWYTYRVKSHTETKTWLYGHNNATVRVQPISQARDLSITFDDVFQSLWDHAVSNIDIDEEIEHAQRDFGAHKTSKH